ncbi:hypothetical protein M885DRAFT_576899 [Pelagophyceae sp. CCMP2097]|nr:hypothetical protein M885DRAFT_576899 [Pelagophyceae sp. CCMP2097]
MMYRLWFLQTILGGFEFNSEWMDWLLTSDGVVKLSVACLIFFVYFTVFGPAPVDERKLEIDGEWAQHRARGEELHARVEVAKKTR